MAVEVNARERVRRRLKALLSEHGVTGRAFGKRLGHGDQWVSNLLNGRFALSLEDLDEAAHLARTTPSELVRHDSDEIAVLSPTEARVVRALRVVPPAIRDHVVTLLDYLRGVAPEEIELLRRFRQLTAEEQQTIVHGLDVLWLTRLDAPGSISIADRMQKADGTPRPSRARGTPPQK